MNDEFEFRLRGSGFISVGLASLIFNLPMVFEIEPLGGCSVCMIVRPGFFYIWLKL